jgi:hypothetical protein
VRFPMFSPTSRFCWPHWSQRVGCGSGPASSAWGTRRHLTEP